MTVKELKETLELKCISLSDPDREVEGGYIGDLLSWVMGRAKSGDAWITIMSNVNILAVASLADTACIILAEGVTLEKDVESAAVTKGVNVLASDKPAYEIAAALSKLLS